MPRSPAKCLLDGRQGLQAQDAVPATCAEAMIASLAPEGCRLRHGGGSRGRGEGGSAPPPLRTPPLWLRAACGCPLAVLCAAIVGIVLFIGIAVLQLLGEDDVDFGAGLFSDDFLQEAHPTAQAVTAPQAGDLGAEVMAVIGGLRKDLARSDEVWQHYSAATSEQLKRLESGLETAAAGAKAAQELSTSAAAKAAAAAEASAAAQAAQAKQAALAEKRLAELQETSGPKQQAPPAVASGPEDAYAAQDLGLDWAAWSSGAEIDHSGTSPGLGRGPVGRAVRFVASILPRYRAFGGNVSHPPEVVLAAGSAPPSRCFTLEGHGAIAVRFVQAVRPTHVIVEQSPPWATVYPRAAPRQFSVGPWPEDIGDAGGTNTSFGSFEYSIDGPPAQLFELSPAGGLGAPGVRGVQVLFKGSWGERFVSVCRVRVLGPPGP